MVCFTEKLQSVALHIPDVHSRTNATKFIVCAHPPIDQRQGDTLWVEKDTSESDVLFNIVNKQILNDLGQLSSFSHAGIT